MKRRSILQLTILMLISTSLMQGQDIPLPEHPRPDLQREKWINLNGSWAFEFDPQNRGLEEGWQDGDHPFSQTITVPFPWGSELSGLDDEADIGWYQRTISIDDAWRELRPFLIIGASDWETMVWVDGKLVGKHQGGYVPISMDLSEYLKPGESHQLVIRVDDIRRDFTLYGKQGYGNARGIWQTIYLEARGETYIDAVHFIPDIDKEQVTARCYLGTAALSKQTLQIQIRDGVTAQNFEAVIDSGKSVVEMVIDLPTPHLWSLDDPFLYEATLSYGQDKLESYFGMRKISVTHLPGTDFPYVALNDKPVYLQLTLDQSYHPEGFYTFPSDKFMKEEIMRSKAIGLNGIRPHIKVEIPRKLYWADKLGVLVMADLPNSWGEPGPRMQAEATYTLREMIKRDFNHPSIFSWVLFNETWGLRTDVEKDGKTQRVYLPSTQAWVASMYYLAKSLDRTRLVEDNSICCGAGHTETDLNSFHDYLPGWAWHDHLQDLTERSHPGSPFQFEDGYLQGTQPKINSECGNVWGYEGSTGDVDWSWDYHRMINSFRMFPEVAGWLYTEHHDVINEWNGYWRFDRTEKFTGFEELVPGMTLNDMHSEVYLSTGNDICMTADAGSEVQVPLFLSSITDRYNRQEMLIQWELEHQDQTGATAQMKKGEYAFNYRPYMHQQLSPLHLQLPASNGLSIVRLNIRDQQGQVLHRNFMHFEIINGQSPDETRIISLPPDHIHSSNWSKKTWQVRDGRKVNGAGTGHFTYRFPLTKSDVENISGGYLLFELSAKELFVKDQDGNVDGNINFMLGGKDAPSRNPNAYPMTDETTFPSTVSILVEGKPGKTIALPDDPADHRGVLSWHHQLKDRKLREAGSYGYLTRIDITTDQLDKAAKRGYLEVTIRNEDGGGVAIYGAQFGRFPVDPSLILQAGY